jgi:hypothetical protein
MAVQYPNLELFQQVKPTVGIPIRNLTLPDGTPMIGPTSLLVPQARQFNMIVNSVTRFFSYRFDEAMRDSWVDARAMLRDAFIRRLVLERLYPTVNRKWQLKVPNDRDPAQMEVRNGLTRVLKRIRDFDQFKFALMSGVWFGRAGTQWACVKDPDLDNMWRIGKWDSIHGDTIQFDFDGNPAILMDTQTAGWYSHNGATNGPGGDIVPTDRGGLALVLKRPHWRERFAIYRHILEKADYFEGELAGSVQGLGLRGLVKWQYTIRTEALAWMLTYMQSVGAMDVLIFNYPAGNEEARIEQTSNANKVAGKIVFVVPRNPMGNWQAVEQLSMNDAGLKALQNLVSEYFDKQIEHLIVGQSMSTGADTDGSLGGSGKAKFAEATKDEIIKFDTGRLDSTMTWEVLPQLKRYNYPWARGFDVEYESIMPDAVERKEKMEAGEKLVNLGVGVKVDELREVANFTRPEAGDETIGGAGGMDGMGMGGGMGGMGGGGLADFGNPNLPGFGGAIMRPANSAPARAPMVPGFSPPTNNDAMGFPGSSNTYLTGTGIDDWRRMPGMRPVSRPVSRNYSSDPRLFTRYGIEPDMPLTDEQIAGELANLVTALNESFGIHAAGNAQAILQAIREKKNGSAAGTPYFNPSQARANDGRFGNTAGAHSGNGTRVAPNAPDNSLRPVTPASENEPNESDIVQSAGMEAQEPGMSQRIQRALANVKQTVYQWAVNASPYVMPIAEQIFDTPQDFQKFGFAPTVSGLAGAGADPVKAATGISAHLAVNIASRVMAYAFVKTKRRLGYSQSSPLLVYPRPGFWVPPARPVVRYGAPYPVNRNGGNYGYQPAGFIRQT